MLQSSSFHPKYTSFAMLMSSNGIREVKTSGPFSIMNLSDLAVRQSIIQDIQLATLWEIEKGETVDFDVQEFLRLVPETDQRQRVLHLMWHDDIKDLIVGKVSGNAACDGQLRIKTDPVSMKLADDYCSVWARF